MKQSHHERLTTVLLGPHLSEKATNVGEQSNQVVFKVRVDAKKPEIKAAVEKLFDVKVTNVNVINTAGKLKRLPGTRQMGYRNAWKKAYVSLAEGSDINFMGAE